MNTIDDLGTSSITILCAELQIRYTEGDVPYDPSDFSRCRKVLQALGCGDAKDRSIVLLKVAKIHPDWRPFYEHWEELEMLWREEGPSGSAPKLHLLMQSLRPEPIRAHNGSNQNGGAQ